MDLAGVYQFDNHIIYDILPKKVYKTVILNFFKRIGQLFYLEMNVSKKTQRYGVF